ncbi:ubiquitin carboxy-terminal hydrolase (macronuclear) [Tetrahymena thermophila SB210]|uniref:Ubiquitin carboxy-terminal hydrolase n=1 Tax=Tetrahymena thermophila (strain SB210) TaxID=312017 RepID=I7LUY7_TETTS|nr:ubiquitin carboxy-terminal hydrolase [Tetrahymena thermophila SB210]EAR96319.2 ubiquitin carboxy-terminal hydrolase [Tetrahymena thermophila SB210]|eukprot:XP_001016564.2 ubiquitin carboxy-terminal hydrolase [Tetrahymena thermophila SB210]
MDSPNIKSNYYTSSPIQNFITQATEPDRLITEFCDFSGLKNSNCEEEIIDDDDELVPQVPQTLEKKIPLMNKYFRDRTRSDKLFTQTSLQSLATLKTENEKEKKQSNQNQEHLESIEQKEEEDQILSQQKQQKNEAAEEIGSKIEKSQSKQIKNQEGPNTLEDKQSQQQLEKQEEVEEQKQQGRNFSFSNHPQTPKRDSNSSSINLSEQKNSIFDTPKLNSQSPQQLENQTPSRINQEKNQKEQQQPQLISQRISTESTSTSSSSQIVTVFQMPNFSNSNNYNQCTSLSNTSFSSTQNDNNISQTSTKQSDISINETISMLEINEIASKLKRLPAKERKMKELVLIKEWNQDKYYSHIIDISWAVQYTKWLSDPHSTASFSLPISNSNLIDYENKTVKKGIKEKINFDIVSSKVYFLMRCLYGGGPDIPLSRQSSSTSSKSITEAIKSAQNVKQPSSGGIGENLFSKQSSSTSTAATTNPSMLEYHNRAQKQMIPSQFDNQVIQTADVVRPSQLFKKQALGVRGLHNQSNYCYLNASVQCLLSIPELNSYFLSEEYRRVVKIQGTRKALKIVPVYADMIKLYEKTSENNILDMNLLKKVIKKPFIPHEQHDAQEFIRYILSEIQDELNPILPSKNPTQFKDSEEAYQYYLRFQNSIIDYIFSGQLSSNVNCSKCGYISRTYDPFLDLSLGMDSKTTSVQDCLNKFFSEEILSDDYKCEKCNQNNKAKKQVLISKTPYILTLHLKRFKIYPKKRKITDFIKYPIQNLSIKQYVKNSSTSGGYYYNLIGIIVHSGSQDSGHYISYVKRENRWFCCDDGKYQEVSEKTVIKQEVYLLFYQRIEESPEVNQQKKIAQ